MSQKSYDNTPTLYLIPTPIGNMEDITIRAINTLKNVEVVFCEDTRVTNQLLKYFNIEKKLISSHKFNENSNDEKLLSYLKSGYDVGLVSDRGTPIISDPGYSLAVCAINNGYNVVSLPGATALIPALTSSSISPMPFYYYGFLNSNSSKRKKEIENLKYLTSTLIFYESPHRLKEMLKDLGNILGNNRNCSISREITKKHEEIYRGTLENIESQIKTLKGEFVIIVEGNKDLTDFTTISIKEHVDMYVENGSKPMDAIKLVAKERKIKKSDVYNEYHKGDKK